MGLLFRRRQREADPELSPDSVEKYYQAWTSRYIESFEDVFQANQGSDRESFFNYYVDSIGVKDGMYMLDAGCGIGGPAIELASRKDVTITAMNISELQLEEAGKKIAGRGLDHRIHLVHGDFHQLSSLVGDQRYDIVYFMESLVHSQDPGTVLREAARCLKPGGILYIKDLFKRRPPNFIANWRINRSIRINNRMFQLNILPKEIILNALEDIGAELRFCRHLELETNQDVGNAFVIRNKLVTATTDWYPYLEFYEIKAIVK